MDSILTGDCLRHLAALPAASVDLAFADPPFNIGYDYDVYDDRRARDDYLAWTDGWLRAVRRVLKPGPDARPRRAAAARPRRPRGDRRGPGRRGGATPASPAG